ncbi:MAG: hypothetical protein V1650_04000 [Candidatus Omnitrophota bacterium]
MTRTFLRTKLLQKILFSFAIFILSFTSLYAVEKSVDDSAMESDQQIVNFL